MIFYVTKAVFLFILSVVFIICYARVLRASSLDLWHLDSNLPTLQYCYDTVSRGPFREKAEDSQNDNKCSQNGRTSPNPAIKLLPPTNENERTFTIIWVQYTQLTFTAAWQHSIITSYIATCQYHDARRNLCNETDQTKPLPSSMHIANNDVVNFTNFNNHRQPTIHRY